MAGLIQKKTEEILKNIVLGELFNISGSVRGMREHYWGYDCDVVRIGKWIYRINWR